MAEISIRTYFLVYFYPVEFLFATFYGPSSFGVLERSDKILDQ